MGRGPANGVSERPRCLGQGLGLLGHRQTSGQSQVRKGGEPGRPVHRRARPTKGSAGRCPVRTPPCSFACRAYLPIRSGVQSVRDRLPAAVGGWRGQILVLGRACRAHVCYVCRSASRHGVGGWPDRLILRSRGLLARDQLVVGIHRGDGEPSCKHREPPVVGYQPLSRATSARAASICSGVTPVSMDTASRAGRSASSCFYEWVMGSRYQAHQLPDPWQLPPARRLISGAGIGTESELCSRVSARSPTSAHPTSASCRWAA